MEQEHSDGEVSDSSSVDPLSKHGFLTTLADSEPHLHATNLPLVTYPPRQNANTSSPYGSAAIVPFEEREGRSATGSQNQFPTVSQLGMSFWQDEEPSNESATHPNTNFVHPERLKFISSHRWTFSEQPAPNMYHPNVDPNHPRAINHEKELFPRQRSPMLPSLSLPRNIPQPSKGWDLLVYEDAHHEYILTPPDRADGEVIMMGSGESYRPGRDRSRSPSPIRKRFPPRADTYRERDWDRSPPRRSPPYQIDSYQPGARSPLRRSRSPPYRARDRTPPRDIQNWRRARSRSHLRHRSPPPRFAPKRDNDRRARSPQGRNDRSRSPWNRERLSRARSPLARRSPPHLSKPYRDRISPGRRERTGPNSLKWRQRSASPQRDSERTSGKTSGSNSRRNSPPVHSGRAVLTQVASQPKHSNSRSPPRALAYRERAKDSASIRDQDSVGSATRERSPPRSPPPALRAPTGPSCTRNFMVPAPHSRSELPSAPPSGPRGSAPPRGPSYMSRGRGSFSGERPARLEPSSWGAAPSTRPSPKISTREAFPVRSRTTQSPSTASTPTPSTSSSNIPSGPSASTTQFSIPTGPRAGPIAPRPSSTMYNRDLPSSSDPRVHPALQGMIPIIPGGRIDPTASGIPGELEARLERRQEEGKLLRDDHYAKIDKLRKGLRLWIRWERESVITQERTELSEKHVRTLAGEETSVSAF